MFGVCEIAILMGVTGLMMCRQRRRHWPCAPAPVMHWQRPPAMPPGPPPGGPRGSRHARPPGLMWILLIIGVLWLSRDWLPRALPSPRMLLGAAALVLLMTLFRQRRGLIATAFLLGLGFIMLTWRGGPGDDHSLVDLDVADRIGERFERRAEEFERRAEHFGEHFDRLGEHIEQAVEQAVEGVVDPSKRAERRHRDQARGNSASKSAPVTVKIELRERSLAERSVDQANLHAALRKLLGSMAEVEQPGAIDVGALSKVLIAEHQAKAVVFGDVSRIAIHRPRGGQGDLVVRVSVDDDQRIDLEELALELEREDAERASDARLFREVDADDETLTLRIAFDHLRVSDLAVVAKPASSQAEPASAVSTSDAPAAAPIQTLVAAADASPATAPPAPSSDPPATLPSGEAPAAPETPTAPQPPTAPEAPTAPTPPAPPSLASNTVQETESPQPVPKRVVKRSWRVPEAESPRPKQCTEKPEWVDREPGLVDGVYYLVAANGPFLKEDRDRELFELVRSEARRYFEVFEGRPMADESELHVDQLERLGAFREFYFEPRPTSFGEMYQVRALLAFDDRARAFLRLVDQRAKRADRLERVAAGSGLALALLGTLLGYLKLDTATRGYYTGRLRVLASAMAVGAAAIAGLVWQGHLRL